MRSKFVFYGFEIPVKEFEKDDHIELLRKFFTLGKKWSTKYKVYFYGIGGEVRADFWNPIKDVVLDFARVADEFIFIAGPVFSIEKRWKKNSPLYRVIRK